MNRLIVISAPSGAGKTTLCRKLLENTPELMLSISTTTRAPRGREKQGVEYFFVTKDAFKEKIDQDGFAEWAEVHGNFYGTSRDFVEKAFREGKSLLLDIDVQGAEEIRRWYPKESFLVFICPPSMEELERRLRARGTDSEETIRKRLRNAAVEMRAAKDFDHILVNDKLEKTYFELQSLVNYAIRGQVIA